MSRSVLRNVFRLVILLFITTTVSASPRDADRTPGLSVERGEMRGFDKDSQAVVLRTATGDESFRLTSATILREGDHVIQPGDLWRFVGHSAKARVQRSKRQTKGELDHLIDGLTDHLELADDRILPNPLGHKGIAPDRRSARYREWRRERSSREDHRHVRARTGL
jgi:hypothetical protein